MIYTKLTSLAMDIAYQAHHGQVDKSGRPYIFHPYHLAEQMDDEYSICITLLHDVIEDTPITFEELENYFPTEIIEALRLLIHDQSVDYFEYIKQIKKDPLALKVKRADLAHNMDCSRLIEDNLNENYLNRLYQKYQKALDLLKEE